MVGNWRCSVENKALKFFLEVRAEVGGVEVGKILGVSGGFVSMVASGKRKVSPEMVVRLGVYQVLEVVEILVLIMYCVKCY